MDPSSQQVSDGYLVMQGSVEARVNKASQEFEMKDLSEGIESG